MSDLRNRSALISGVGARGGLGYAIAEELKRSGARIFITSTTERVFERAAELGAEGFVADLTKIAEVENCISQINHLDILVNNAGMTSINNPLSNREIGDLTSLTFEDWQSGIARNLDTAFNLTKAALPLLRQSGRGRIIMISSVTGGLMAMRNQPAYAAGKAAMIGLMRSLALDEAKHQITCNAVLPGWIATDSQPKEEFDEGLLTPAGRNGTPAEIASLVGWLSGDGSAYMTGRELVVDGGNSIKEEGRS
jgi:3-oxoacyl-[acyl-carrier protein] reductase